MLRLRSARASRLLRGVVGAADRAPGERQRELAGVADVGGAAHEGWVDEARGGAAGLDDVRRAERARRALLRRGTDGAVRRELDLEIDDGGAAVDRRRLALQHELDRVRLAGGDRERRRLRAPGISARRLLARPGPGARELAAGDDRAAVADLDAVLAGRLIGRARARAEPEAQYAEARCCEQRGDGARLLHD